MAYPFRAFKKKTVDDKQSTKCSGKIRPVRPEKTNTKPSSNNAPVKVLPR